MRVEGIAGRTVAARGHVPLPTGPRPIPQRRPAPPPPFPHATHAELGAAEAEAAEQERRARHSHAKNTEAWVAAYQGGEPIASIARRYHVGTPRVRGALVEAGIPIRPRSESGREPRGAHVDLSRSRDLLDAYAAGATQQELAARFGVSPNTIGRALRRSGVAVRGRGVQGVRDRGWTVPAGALPHRIDADGIPWMQCAWCGTWFAKNKRDGRSVAAWLTRPRCCSVACAARRRGAQQRKGKS